MQPRRVILTFGTNDLNPGYKAADFVKNYRTGIEAIVTAYPSVDIIVNAIPPIGQQHSNQSLTQTQVDEYNKALVEMCQEKDWKFLNSAEVLKDSVTGYAKSGYVETSDGIHLTRTAMDALFQLHPHPPATLPRMNRPRADDDPEAHRRKRRRGLHGAGGQLLQHRHGDGHARADGGARQQREHRVTAYVENPRRRRHPRSRPPRPRHPRSRPPRPRHPRSRPPRPRRPR